ncbi:MAG: serine hydrolase [Candidatus Eisenbacteria bacterium]
MRLRHSISWFVMLCLAATVCSAGTPSPADLGALAREAFASGATPGMSIAIVQGDTTLFVSGYGYASVEEKIPVTPETAFYLASTGKAFTALEVQLLAAKGEFSLDDPLSKLLPGAALDSALDPNKISLRDLLTHTHGISGRGPVTFRCAFTGEGTGEELAGLLRFHPPAKEGRSFSYSNLGYDVAGLIIDRKVKGGWRAGIERDVLTPLGMRRSGPRVSRVSPKDMAQPYERGAVGFERIRYGKRDENMNASGGELSTAADLARFVRVHLNGGWLEGRSIIPERVILESRRKQAQQTRQFGEMTRYGWGLGWDLAMYEGDTLVSRFGDFPGFRSHVSYMPSRGIGVVVLVNGGGASAPLADIVALSLYDRLLERADVVDRLRNRLAGHGTDMQKAAEGIRLDRERRAGRDQRLPHALSAYAGDYVNPQFGRMRWTTNGDRLEVTMGAAGCTAEVFDASTNKMRVELTGGGSIVEFEIPPGGARATALKFLDAQFTRSGS